MLELLRSLDDEAINAAKLARKIGYDPVLSARVLKIVNSPFFGVTGQVSSLPEAVMVLGFSNVRSLALAASLIGSFPMHDTGEFDPRRLWRHSFCCALCAQSLAPLAKVDAEAAFTGGLLHDIGKIGLPDELLAKPFNQLTPDERNEAVKHPAKGEALLMGLEQLQGAARLIRAHHERFDGLGYPDRVSGICIPLGARILAVANDYDAVQQGSLFAKRATPEEAVNYLHAGRAKRYDPTVLDAFASVLGGPPRQKAASRALGADQLKPGMVLAKDLVTCEGVLLLARDYVIDDKLIRQIHSFEATEGYSLKIHVAEGKP